MAVKFIKIDLTVITDNLRSQWNNSQSKIVIYATCMEKKESIILFTLHFKRKKIDNFLLQKKPFCHHKFTKRTDTRCRILEIQGPYKNVHKTQDWLIS